MDLAAAERAIYDFLRALGHDPAQDPELRETPARVADAFANDLLSGYHVDVRALLESGGAVVEGCKHDIVVARHVAIASVCPHHLLPSLGHAVVAYVPGTRVLGIGALAALVDAYSRRLTLQESISRNVVDALVTWGCAEGAYCRLSFVHACLSARGNRQANAVVETAARAGSLALPDGDARLLLALGHGGEEK